MPGTSRHHTILTLTLRCCWDHLLGEAFAVFKGGQGKGWQRPWKAKPEGHSRNQRKRM